MSTNKENFRVFSNVEDSTGDSCDVAIGLDTGVSWIYLGEKVLIEMLEGIREKRHEIAMEIHPIAKLTSDHNIIRCLLHPPKVQLSDEEWKIIINLFYTDNTLKLSSLEPIFSKIVLANPEYVELQNLSLADLYDGKTNQNLRNIFHNAIEYFDDQTGLAFNYKNEWHQERWKAKYSVSE